MATVIQELSTRLSALARIAEHGNGSTLAHDWSSRHLHAVEFIQREYLPEGTKVDMMKSRRNLIVLSFAYTLRGDGVAWAKYKAAITPDFVAGYVVEVKGPDDDTRKLIQQELSEALGREFHFREGLS